MLVYRGYIDRQISTIPTPPSCCLPSRDTSQIRRRRLMASGSRSRATRAGDVLTLGKPTPLFRLPADAGGLASAWSANADHSKFVVADAPNAEGQTFRVMTDWK